MDSIEVISERGNYSLPEQLLPTEQAGESHVNRENILGAHFLPQYVMETVELFQDLPNFWLVMSKQMWKQHLKVNKNSSVSISRRSRIGQLALHSATHFSRYIISTEKESKFQSLLIILFFFSPQNIVRANCCFAFTMFGLPD